MFTSKYYNMSSTLVLIALSLIVTLLTFYRKIKDIKQYTVDEGKKVNDSLKAYQIRYDE